MKIKTLGQVRCSIERTSSMLSTPYLHTGWAFENCALGCSLGLIFSGYVPLATSSPGFDPLAGGGGGANKVHYGKFVSGL